MEGQEGVAGQETIVCCGRHHQLKAAIDEGTKPNESYYLSHNINMKNKYNFIKDNLFKIDITCYHAPIRLACIY